MEKKYIFQDKDLQKLSEDTPLPEGATLEEFEAAAREVLKAADKIHVNPRQGKTRALFLMRGLYFLGVLRGGEAYRNALLCMDDPETPEPETVPFELSEVCTELFVDDLKSMGPAALEKLCQSLGI